MANSSFPLLAYGQRLMLSLERHPDLRSLTNMTATAQQISVAASLIFYRHRAAQLLLGRWPALPASPIVWRLLSLQAEVAAPIR